ncbi:MAG: hypothetical protein ACFE0I_02425 [Elainellaceae cyanobacterium]
MNPKLNQDKKYLESIFTLDAAQGPNCPIPANSFIRQRKAIYNQEIYEIASHYADPYLVSGVVGDVCADLLFIRASIYDPFYAEWFETNGSTFGTYSVPELLCNIVEFYSNPKSPYLRLTEELLTHGYSTAWCGREIFANGAPKIATYP